ncbi:mannose-1-phosphate guanylyltransferase [Aeromicrobium sp. YIM 150415]|uniref:mannose-1-phosphate guanylyltransferase n=1 Tax=Aeromicrobium sp. YIM 150415 TaxID=2803912 RepID=UPI001965EBC3|nr:mannose-1-phosphate guanylyltransferase [Aeromicrobium sp. YIM 150415]MBM9464770.1 mannose-1-phosphate guanylyltransferase [Aeromicrobium sp. YIM 150415]
MSQLHAIIPAGGAGTRLWPLSRAGHPKFLLDLTGTGRSLLQQTSDRLSGLAAGVHVVTGRAHDAAVTEQLPDAEVLAEPSPRDSMPAIGLAAAVIARRDPEAIVGSFAADHVIDDTAGFTAAVREAVEVAETGRVVTIGLTPVSPSTAFGYIDGGARLDGFATARTVRRFVEKPDLETAREYLAAGTYAWNAGMFVVRASVLLDHLARLQPTMHAGLLAIAEAWDTPERETALEEHWPRLTSIAIDHAIAEPVSLDGGVAVVPGTFDWTDLGDFAALADRTSSAEAVWVDAEGFVANTTEQTVSVVGLDDVVVAVTGDAILVTTRAAAQRVKVAPGQWRDRGRADLL